MSANSKPFNLLKYVYGQLFLSALETTRSSMIIERWKYRSWAGILRWLEDQKYISCLSIEHIDNKQTRINYVFNHNQYMYFHYLKCLQIQVGSRTIKMQQA